MATTRDDDFGLTPFHTFGDSGIDEDHLTNPFLASPAATVEAGYITNDDEEGPLNIPNSVFPERLEGVRPETAGDTYDIPMMMRSKPDEDRDLRELATSEMERGDALPILPPLGNLPQRGGMEVPGGITSPGMTQTPTTPTVTAVPTTSTQAPPEQVVRHIHEYMPIPGETPTATSRTEAAGVITPPPATIPTMGEIPTPGRPMATPEVETGDVTPTMTAAPPIQPVPPAAIVPEARPTEPPTFTTGPATPVPPLERTTSPEAGVGPAVPTTAPRPTRPPEAPAATDVTEVSDITPPPTAGATTPRVGVQPVTTEAAAGSTIAAGGAVEEGPTAGGTPAGTRPPPEPTVLPTMEPVTRVAGPPEIERADVGAIQTTPVPPMGEMGRMEVGEVGALAPAAYSPPPPEVERADVTAPVTPTGVPALEPMVTAAPPEAPALPPMTRPTELPEIERADVTTAAPPTRPLPGATPEAAPVAPGGAVTFPEPTRGGVPPTVEPMAGMETSDVGPVPTLGPMATVEALPDVPTQAVRREVTRPPITPVIETGDVTPPTGEVTGVAPQAAGAEINPLPAVGYEAPELPRPIGPLTTNTPPPTGPPTLRVTRPARPARTDREDTLARSDEVSVIPITPTTTRRAVPTVDETTGATTPEPTAEVEEVGGGQAGIGSSGTVIDENTPQGKAIQTALRRATPGGVDPDLRRMQRDMVQDVWKQDIEPGVETMMSDTAYETTKDAFGRFTGKG